MGEEGGGVCELECPKCKKTWGKMKFEYGGCVKPRDIKILRGRRKKIQDGDSLECTECGFQYTNWDVMLAIATAKTERA